MSIFLASWSLNAATATISNCTFEKNTVFARNEVAYGGGVALLGGLTIEISGSIFFNSTVECTGVVDTCGGGAIAAQGGMKVLVSESVFCHSEVRGLNGTTVTGGVLGMADQQLVSIRGCTFKSVLLKSTRGDAWGGAINARNPVSLHIEDCFFHESC